MKLHTILITFFSLITFDSLLKPSLSSTLSNVKYFENSVKVDRDGSTIFTWNFRVSDFDSFSFENLFSTNTSGNSEGASITLCDATQASEDSDNQVQLGCWRDGEGSGRVEVSDNGILTFFMQHYLGPNILDSIPAPNLSSRNQEVNINDLTVNTGFTKIPDQNDWKDGVITIDHTTGAKDIYNLSYFKKESSDFIEFRLTGQHNRPAINEPPLHLGILGFSILGIKLLTKTKK